MTPKSSYRTSYFFEEVIRGADPDASGEHDFTDWCQGWAEKGWHLEHVTTVKLSTWSSSGVRGASLLHTCIWVTSEED